MHADSTFKVAVVGHTSCGGVVAACTAATSNSTPADTPLNRYLKDLTSLASEIHNHDAFLNSSALVSNVTVQSVKRQVNNIVSTDVIKANWNSEVSPLSNKTMPLVSVHG
jgi:carbonic anhydrase